MLRLSFTKLSLYDYCPWAYRFRYVEKAPTKFRPRLLLGANVHSVIDAFLVRVRDGLSTGWAEMERIFEERWAETFVLDTRANAVLKEKAFGLIRGFWDANAADFGRPALIEERFVLPIEDVRVEGIVDRVEDLGAGRAEVIDYKSGRAPQGNPAEGNLQLLIYALACRHVWGLEPKLTSLYFLADNRKLSAPVAEDGLRDVQEHILSRGKAITREEFTPTTGPHCRDCDYFDMCEFGRAWAKANG